MDSHVQQQQQKEFLSNFFPQDVAIDLNNRLQNATQPQTIFQYNGSNTPQAASLGRPDPPSNEQINMDLLGNLMAMQGIESQANLPWQNPFSPQLLLEQQFKVAQLQQLQQLQNRIFQQQIALISTPGTILPEVTPEPQREAPTNYNGLLTPGPSSELRPQPNTDYVSPINLQQYMDTPLQEPYRNHAMGNLSPSSQPSLIAHYAPHRGSTSAPAHIAFQTSSSDLDFDVSPISSPWLAPHQQSMALRHNPNKRTASPSGEDTPGASRKKQSPVTRPTNPSSAAKKANRGSKSMTSTPLIRLARSRKSSVTGDMVHDTPSPVDLSMPPPAAATNQGPSFNASSNTITTNISQNPITHLTPVTPASIMNIERFDKNHGLAPPIKVPNPPQIDGKGKGVARSRTAAEPSTRRSKRTASGSLTSPNLKSILPAGSAPNNVGGSSAQAQPVTQKKSSHKDAEQKRRDALKTSYDDLRGLLPPIPLPSDENFPDEPILPGALPPRGPPKVGGEGPNKGVSKLQLLMCGNDYIRQLKGRVERRDEEIQRLRQTVAQMRELIADESMISGLEDLDLERDLDAVEAFSLSLGQGGPVNAEDEGDEEGD